MIKYIQVNEITVGRFANDRAREMIKKYNDGNDKHLILKVYEPYQNCYLTDILEEGQFDYMSLADDKEIVEMLEELSDNASPCYFDEEDVEVLDEDDIFPVPPMSEVKRAKSEYHRATTAPARVGSRTVRSKVDDTVPPYSEGTEHIFHLDGHEYNNQRCWVCFVNYDDGTVDVEFEDESKYSRCPISYLD